MLKFSTVKIFAIGLAGSLVLRLINCTLRWTTVGLDGNDKFWPHGTPRMLIFWHGHQLFMPQIYLRGRRDKTCPTMSALISEHEDGRMIAKAMEFLGIGSVAGSSTRRGLKAMHELIAKLRAGQHISITPDGPKGPRGKIKGGILKIAQRTGVPIYPTAIGAEKKWVFSSWDQMFIPKPFSKAVIIMGQPISIARTLNPEELNACTEKVQKALDDVARQAEEFNYT